MVKKMMIVGLVVAAVGIAGCGKKSESQASPQRKEKSDASKVYDQLPESPRLK